MNKNINLYEILKDCPKGMELDCTMYDNCTFNGIEDVGYINILVKTPSGIIRLTKEGCYIRHDDYAKCVIFPKGKTTWEGFIPPCKFNAGDVLVSTHGNIVLFSHIDSEDFVHYHCIIPTYRSFRIEENTNVGVGRYYNCVLANEQQRQRMYDKIKCSGYEYNQSINKLEKIITPNFKVGDIIQDKNSYKVRIINVNMENRSYSYESLITKGVGEFLFEEQYDWKLMEYQVGDHFIHPTDPELFIITEIRSYDIYKIQKLRGSSYVINKYDLHKYSKVNKWNQEWFKPFDKVLIRNTRDVTWTATLFSHICNSKEYPYKTSYTIAKHCIPYNFETKHLVGTNLEEPEFYKL